MANYEQREGRPYEFILIPASATSITLPDECGGLVFSVSGNIFVTMKNEIAVRTLANVPLGFLPGDFRFINFTTVELYAALVSR